MTHQVMFNSRAYSRPVRQAGGSEQTTPLVAAAISATLEVLSAAVILNPNVSAVVRPDRQRLAAGAAGVTVTAVEEGADTGCTMTPPIKAPACVPPHHGVPMAVLGSGLNPLAGHPAAGRGHTTAKAAPTSAAIISSHRRVQHWLKHPQMQEGAANRLGSAGGETPSWCVTKAVQCSLPAMVQAAGS